VIRAVLQLRKAEPWLFAQGDDRPLAAVGPAAQGFLGFTRRAGAEGLMVAAALHPDSHDMAARAEMRITLPETEGSRWINRIDGQSLDPRDLRAVFAHLPLAILRPQ
jgi:(1->4)-alpha-D-glucan 1-alpha-D-glucosylmutase